jgi:hypothetical protein
MGFALVLDEGCAVENYENCGKFNICDGILVKMVMKR